MLCSERESCIVANNVSQSTCSHLCDENVGHMGKEPANTCTPHRVDYCIVLALYMRHHVKLTIVGGLCSHGDHYDPDFQFRDSWHVTSLGLSLGC
jgi:hypothetical protein